MAIEDKNKLKLSRRVASVWVVISMSVAILIGIVGYSLMTKGIVGPYADSSASETIIVDVAKVISVVGCWQGSDLFADLIEGKFAENSAETGSARCRFGDPRRNDGTELLPAGCR